MDMQNISNHSSFIYKPTQEIHDKQVQKYDLNEQKKAKKFKPTFSNKVDWP